MRYLIPAVLTLIVGVVLWQLQKERTALDYEVVTSEQFPRETGVGRYFVVRIRNAGNKEIRDIDLSISLRSGVIETKRFSTPNLINLLTENRSDFHGRLPLVNPGEIFAVTITATGSADVGPLEVIARAPGATATPRDDSSIWVGAGGALATIIVAALSAFGLVAFSSYRTARFTDSIAKSSDLKDVARRIEETKNQFDSRFARITDSIAKSSDLKDVARRIEETKNQFDSRLNEITKHIDDKKESIDDKLSRQLREHAKQREAEEKGLPDAPQIILAIFNRFGLSHRFHQLVSEAGDITYWRTALRLLEWFLQDEGNRDSYVRAAEAILEQERLAPSSHGFVLYMLGKMEQFRGNTNRALDWLGQCKEKRPLMYAHLMAQDPYYDLAVLRDRLHERGGE